jgi:hypothetical protein
MIDQGLRIHGVINRKAERREELRNRRDAIRRQLEGSQALTDAQELELTREMRKIQVELRDLGEGAA